jgi:hypothetical protein
MRFIKEKIRNKSPLNKAADILLLQFNFFIMGQPLLRATLNGQKKGAAEAAPLPLASKLFQLGFESVVTGQPAPMLDDLMEFQFLLLVFYLLFEVTDSVEHLSPLHFELNVFERLECGERLLDGFIELIHFNVG